MHVIERIFTKHHHNNIMHDGQSHAVHAQLSLILNYPMTINTLILLLRQFGSEGCVSKDITMIVNHRYLQHPY